MALKVVGSGLGRTGTKSMQSALNMLGVGPCHHMVEVFAHPESRFLWIDAAAGRPDWDAIFAGYQSMVDYPGAHYWRADSLPIIRMPRCCTRCAIPTNGLNRPRPRSSRPTVPHRGRDRSAEFFATFTGAFGDKIHDRAFMTDYFRRHTEEVKRTIPAERLLIYNVGDGWEPLCKFLGLPVPDAPYPSENSRAEFIARAKGRVRRPAGALIRRKRFRRGGDGIPAPGAA